MQLTYSGEFAKKELCKTSEYIIWYKNGRSVSQSYKLCQDLIELSESVVIFVNPKRELL